MSGFYTVPNMWADASYIPQIRSFKSTTTSGIATFNLTEDGTPTGTACFASITGINPIAERNTSTPIQYPNCSLKSISANKKQMEITVGNGTSLLALGATNVNAPDGTVVWLTVFGSPGS